MATSEKVRSDVAKRTLANLKNFRVSIDTENPLFWAKFRNDHTHRLTAVQTAIITVSRILKKINNNFDSSAFI
jgi:hypothetical protein